MVALGENVRISVSLERGLERQKDDPGVGQADGDQAGVGDDCDAFRVFTAERLPGGALELARSRRGRPRRRIGWGLRA